MAVAHRVYAEALLEAAKKGKRLDKVRKEFEEFVTAVEASDELRRFLHNPQIDPHTKGEALQDLLAGLEAHERRFWRSSHSRISPRLSVKSTRDTRTWTTRIPSPPPKMLIRE